MSYTSFFDLFTIGIGPSSSHTVGPMVAARKFVEGVPLDHVTGVTVELFGSLALTGRGHGTPNAVLLGLAGFEPESVPMDVASGFEGETAATGRLRLGGRRDVAFDVARDIVFTEEFHPAHANVLELTALGERDTVLAEEHWVSIGGGFVLKVDDLDAAVEVGAATIPFPYRSGRQLLEVCVEHDLSIAEVAMANEKTSHTAREVAERVRLVAEVMFEVVDRGMAATGILPGGLNVQRRAASLSHELTKPSGVRLPPTGPSDWAGVWATAVGEENAAGHRIVTAPTNGAAGIIPAVLKFLSEHCEADCEDPELAFLLTATAIGSLLKANAGISGAELGCQGEVGSACAMAAAGLAAALGGTPRQVENAAEIALEHNLGLTCDPLAGLVQVPCIERNAVGAVKAIAAASMSLRGSGDHIVSLDAAIATMRQTGRDMNRIYKETSLGGLAVNFSEC